MKPSDPRRRRASEVLDQLERLLTEAYLVQQIDEPIDQATRVFECPDDPGLSPRQIVGWAAAFLQYLYAKAFPRGRQLSLAQALDEAVALLQQAYPDRSPDGYIEGLLEATNPSEPGMALVLVRLAEVVKTRHRHMYMRWVEASLIDPADWQTKCDMAAILMDRCRPWLPTHLQHAPPEQVADRVVNLLALDMATRGRAQPTPGTLENPFD